jgi:hypothetical protein
MAIINGQVTSFSYKDDSNIVDSLNRLRKITRPDGSWTKFSFGETAANFFKLTEIPADRMQKWSSYSGVRKISYTITRCGQIWI